MPARDSGIPMPDRGPRFGSARKPAVHSSQAIFLSSRGLPHAPERRSRRQRQGPVAAAPNQHACPHLRGRRGFGHRAGRHGRGAVQRWPNADLEDQPQWNISIRTDPQHSMKSAIHDRCEPFRTSRSEDVQGNAQWPAAAIGPLSHTAASAKPMPARIWIVKAKLKARV